MISVLDILEDTTVDGPGFRTTIYCAGCPNRCLGCHNPESWNQGNGQALETEEILWRRSDVSGKRFYRTGSSHQGEE